VSIEESLLHRVELAFGRESFDGDDALSCHRAHFRDASFLRRPVHQHRARRALSFAAAEFGAGKIQVVAEDAEECAVGIRIDSPPSAVHKQFSDSGHAPIMEQVGRRPPYFARLAVISNVRSRPTTSPVSFISSPETLPL